MSLVMQVNAAKMATERQIDEQIQKLSAFNGKLERVKSQVDLVLSGSQTDYANQMMQQLDQTKKQIDDTITKLRTAKQKLFQIRV